MVLLSKHRLEPRNMQDIKLVNIDPSPPRVSLRDLQPSLHDGFVVSLKGGDNLGERDKKCHLFCGTLEPISRADQPYSPDTSSSSLITIRLFIIFTKNKD